MSRFECAAFEALVVKGFSLRVSAAIGEGFWS
jgi:hypothetical protein